MHTYTLFELNEFTRRVIALNFPNALWITAEVAQCKFSKGSFYLDLVQKNENNHEIIAQTSAVIWPSDLVRMRKTHKNILDDLLLQAGLAIRIQVRVEFHERYGLKLIIEDIDPAWTLGELEMHRLDTIKKLEAMGILRRNANNILPTVLQRIAVISSETAAGYQDFVKHLQNNNFGYHFGLTLFPSAVQGTSAVNDLMTALELVKLGKSEFDAVVIIRGGGAKLDLVAFDAFEFCKSVAHFPLPVLSGIGHETDISVLDMVAHTSMKTPTAVADFIIHRNMVFESKILEQEENIRSCISFKVQAADHTLKYLQFTMDNAMKNLLKEKKRTLQEKEEAMPVLLERFIVAHHKKLDDISQLCKALHPLNVLKRGFTRTLVNGKQSYSVNDAKDGDTLQTQWADGTLLSQVVKSKS